MRSPREEIPRPEAIPKVVDLISTVKKLHGLSSLELSKLIRDSRNNTLQLITENGLSIKIDVEDLAKIPIHLIAKLVQFDLNEALLKHLLSGLSLLHTLYDIAPRFPKLEQILLDDISLSRQLFDMIFYILIVVNNNTQEHQPSTPITLLHSTLVSSSLYLLTGFVSSQWPELASVLVHHPKVDRFMDAAFAAVRVDIELLQIMLSAEPIDLCENSSPTAEEPIKHLCQQCEASLQFLQTLCQQKLFQDHLVKHKELCGKGGIILLARLILNFNIPTSLSEQNYFAAAVSRMKSKVLSILLHLCEAESISYLDEVASTPGSLGLAKSVALEVLELLKTLFSGCHKELSSCLDKNNPKGILQLNAMRLADVLSDDTNFRSYITMHITEVLTGLFLLPHGEFLSCWCASDPVLWEEDATLEYDPFVAAGWVLNLLSSSDLLVTMSSESTFIPCNMPRASYAHQRTSLLVKVIANLHCFIPDICEEKDLFLNSFSKCLQKEFPKLPDGFSSKSAAEKTAAISRNLRSLLIHAESLIRSFLNEEDVQLLRVFISQLEPIISIQVQESQFERSISWDKLSRLTINEHHEEAQNAEGSPDHNNIRGHLKEGNSDNSALQEVDHFYTRGKAIYQADDELRQDKTRDEESGFGGVQEDEKAETIQCAETQRRKRKRTIMNDKQTSLIEKALLDKPDMHRHVASLQMWAERLSQHGSEVTASQLKNWLNNRKARLARAAKDVRGPSEGDNICIDKQGGSGTRPLNDSPEDPMEDFYVPLAPQLGHQDEFQGAPPAYKGLPYGSCEPSEGT